MKKILSVFITFMVLMIIIIVIALNVNKNNNQSVDKIKIVATLFPQYDFAKQIGKDKVEVELLLTPGVEAHTYDPSPKDILKINSSDLFIYTGEYMEPWASTIKSSLEENVLVIDASYGVNYIKEEHEEEEHEHEYDPHIWLDVSNAKIMVNNILKYLIQIDPQNEEYYTLNAKEYLSKLDELDVNIKETINNGKRNIICFGDKFSYSYFIETYGLEYISAYDSCLAEAEPSVSKILEIQKQIDRNNIPVIFYESMSEGKIAKSIAKEKSILALVFSSVHTVSYDEINSGATYISVMNQNLENLKIALN